jgi:hypothetical protein
MYKLNQNSVTRLADGASIPFANGNRDYEEYKQWLLDGGVPEPEFTEEELQAKEVADAIQEALSYLLSTDFYFTVDKYATLDNAKKLELEAKRLEARGVINGNH